MSRLLLLFVDALRNDYLSQERTPNLFRILENQTVYPLKPILGYSDAIKATILTGAYPEDHGYWMFYFLSRSISPFGALHGLRWLERIPSEAMRRGAKFLLSRTALRFLARKLGYHNLDMHNIPFALAGFFDLTLRLPMNSPHIFEDHPTLFDILRDNRKKIAYLDSSTMGPRALTGSCLRIRRHLQGQVLKDLKHNDVVFLYLHQLDYYAHRFGIKNPAYEKELKNMDYLLSSLVQNALSMDPDLSIALFSDHGMVDTRVQLDLSWLMKEPGLGQSFLFALDSTMVRLWYFDDGVQDRLRHKLEALPYGRFLLPKELKDLHVFFQDGRFGDEVYLLNPGISIFPNFTSYLRPLAMHAYHPDAEGQEGIAAFAGGSFEDIGSRDRVLGPEDLLPTFLDALAIDGPPSIRGVSVFR